MAESESAEAVVFEARSVEQSLDKSEMSISKEGAPSILYLVDGIPNNANDSKPGTNYKAIAHFQRKKNNGGEVIVEEYKSIGPNMALILFQNAFGKCFCALVVQNGTFAGVFLLL